MDERYSLKDVARLAFEDWEDFVDMVKIKGIPIDFSLNLAGNDYRNIFLETDIEKLSKLVVSELVFNSMKSTLAISALTDILRENFNKSRFLERLPKVEVGLYSRDGEDVLYVEDNGKGISPEIRSKIWEYGFSTFGTTGIGLVGVKKTVSEYRGRIEVESEENVRTRFSVYFPR